MAKRTYVMTNRYKLSELLELYRVTNQLEAIESQVILDRLPRSQLREATYEDMDLLKDLADNYLDGRYELLLNALQRLPNVPGDILLWTPVTVRPDIPILPVLVIHFGNRETLDREKYTFALWPKTIFRSQLEEINRHDMLERTAPRLPDDPVLDVVKQMRRLARDL